MSASTKKKVRVVAGILQREEDGKVLITQRRPTAFMPLKWEFPGGKVEPGETDEQALKRELNEELGIEVEVGPRFMGELYDYHTFELDFQVYRCKLVSGKIQKLQVYQFKWVSISDLHAEDFPPADQTTLSLLLDL